MPRTKYRNGDAVSLGNCNGCSPSTINGILCHESGCPDAWRDYIVECKECERKFRPTSRHQRLCKRCGKIS